jgi:uncharacterized protein (UPF0303 family)
MRGRQLDVSRASGVVSGVKIERGSSGDTARMGWNEDLEQIALQEHELVLENLDTETAWDLGLRLRTLAKERGLGVVIDVRRFGQPLFYAALEGTTPDHVEWVRRKSNVVARFHCSSYAIGLKEKIKNETLFQSQGLPVADYATHGGSFPLTVTGAGVVGSVTVSGLPQRADHELVVEALCAVLGRDYAALKLAAE